MEMEIENSESIRGNRRRDLEIYTVRLQRAMLSRVKE